MNPPPWPRPRTAELQPVVLEEEVPSTAWRGVDWGLGKELDRPEHTTPGGGTGSSALIEAEYTQEGTVMGTPAYLPPEQAAGKPVDERADVYALGAILYQLLSGHPPFRGSSVREVLQRALSIVRLWNLKDGSTQVWGSARKPV